MKRFCALNIGNTHTACAVGIASADGSFQWESVRRFKSSAIPFGELPIDILTVYASVVPQLTAVMQAKFPGSIPCAAPNIPMIDFSDAPPTLGMDRMANCAALLQSSSSGIVIDVGTAITLEVIKNRKFIGGAILPGTAILAKAMHDYTGALPLIESSIAPDIQTFVPETLTVDAMRIGVQSAAVGGTLHLLDKFLQKLPEKSPVFVCGGNRQSILNQHTTVKLIDGGDDFTLRGVGTIAVSHLQKIL